MKKLIRTLYCAVLAVLLLSAAAATAAEETASIRVGNVTCSVNDLRREYEAYLQTMEAAGEPLTDEDKVNILNELAERRVIRCLAEARLRETGNWELSDNELYDIRAAAQAQYEAAWQYLRDLPEASGLSDAEITAYLTENDITLTMLVEEFTEEYRLRKLLALEGSSAEIDDASVDAFYEQIIVLPVRERYENNVPLFEEEVLMAENAATVWIPDGYRMLYQIVLPVPDELQKKLDAIMNEAVQCTSAAAEAYDKIASLAVSGADYSAERDVYNTNMARVDELEVEYGNVWAEVLAACRSGADEIYARLECGEQFEELMLNFSGDHAVLYHPDSTNWPETFQAAADSLIRPGDVSDIALCDDGVHILYYARDMESGMLPLDDTGREQIREQFGSEILTLRLKELTDPWRDVYDVTVDISGITD